MQNLSLTHLKQQAIENNPITCNFGVEHFYQYSPQLVLELRSTLYNVLKMNQEKKYQVVGNRCAYVTQFRLRGSGLCLYTPNGPYDYGEYSCYYLIKYKAALRSLWFQQRVAVRIEYYHLNVVSDVVMRQFTEHLIFFS